MSNPNPCQRRVPVYQDQRSVVDRTRAKAQLEAARRHPISRDISFYQLTSYYLCLVFASDFMLDYIHRNLAQKEYKSLGEVIPFSPELLHFLATEHWLAIQEYHETMEILGPTEVIHYPDLCGFVVKGGFLLLRNARIAIKEKDKMFLKLQHHRGRRKKGIGGGRAYNQVDRYITNLTDHISWLNPKKPTIGLNRKYTECMVDLEERFGIPMEILTRIWYEAHPTDYPRVELIGEQQIAKCEKIKAEMCKTSKKQRTA
jgi:hypothetical protein